MAKAQVHCGKRPFGYEEPGGNIRADDKRLKLRGINIADATLAFDGMKACGFIDSRWGFINFSFIQTGSRGVHARRVCVANGRHHWFYGVVVFVFSRLDAQEIFLCIPGRNDRERRSARYDGR